MRQICTAIWLAAFMSLNAASASAAVITEHALFNHPGDTPLPPTFVASHVSASDFTLVGVTQTPLIHSLIGSGWPEGAFGSSYMEVTITPDPGYEIEFDFVSGNFGGEEDGTWKLAWSVDNFASALVEFENQTAFLYVLDHALSLPAQSGPVTFRFYAFRSGGSDASTMGSRDFIGNRPIRFEGAVRPLQVPEPAVLLLFCAGALGVRLRRRSRRETAAPGS